MTDVSRLVDRFAWLFAGRVDAFGTEAGGCVRGNVDDDTYEAHLAGTPIGIYPVVHYAAGVRTEEWFVKWGACDIDYDDIQEAINFHDLLAQVGIPSYIERSRSKGYHVWVFVENWISAETMRHALLVVRDFLKMDAREIYPKQTTLREGELGNYLRLPYPGWLAEGALRTVYMRRVMLKRQQDFQWLPWPLGLFLDEVEFADPKDLVKLASRYRPPLQRVLDAPWQRENFTDAKHEAIARQTLNRLNHALAWHVYNHGPTTEQLQPGGGGRSVCLMRLCNMVADRGATMEETFSIIWSADSKDWGRKYVDRYDGEQRIRELVERVYRNQVPSPEATP